MHGSFESNVERAEGQPVPFVTVVVPMRNEERYISICLDSIVANDYPKDRLEVLVVDGMSTDRSREIVEDYIQRCPFIRLLENPKRSVPAALNIGIREARGEIIIRMDAHTVYAPDYISRCVELLMTTDAANVGGPMRKVGTTYVSQAIAIATSVPFGVGDSYFHYAESDRYVDTVYLGAWWKATLEQVGCFDETFQANEDYELNFRLRYECEFSGLDNKRVFDEDLIVNQDYELNYRIRRAGGKILLSPKIRCWYYVRPSLQALAHQYFRYGFWKVKTLVKHPDSLRWRQLAPPAFVVAVILSFAILPINPLLSAVLPGLYVMANLLASAHAASRHGWKYFPVLPVVFLTLHLSWGVGFLVGLFKWGIPKLTLRSLVKAFWPPYASCEARRDGGIG